MERKTPKKRDAPKATRAVETPKAHRAPTEREELIHNPNFNQAGNEAGSRARRPETTSIPCPDDRLVGGQAGVGAREDFTCARRLE